MRFRRKRKSNRIASRKPMRSRPSRFEPLEDRHMLSAGNIFSEFVGMLNQAEDVERIDITVAPQELSIGRGSPLLGFHLAARQGNPLDPAPVEIHRADGTTVTPMYSRADLAGGTDSLVVAALGEGDYHIDVSGDLNGRSQFRLEVFLVGDVDGDHAVDRADIRSIRRAYGSRLGDSRYTITADANLDGRITARDLSYARRNERLFGPLDGDEAGGFSALDQQSDGTVYDRIPALVPQSGHDPNAPMRFFETTTDWVQPLPSMDAPQGGVFTVPGTPGTQTTVIVDWFYREAGYGNDLMIYPVSDLQGTVGYLSPGDDGYEALAAGAVIGTLDSPNSPSPGNDTNRYTVPAPLELTLDAGTYFSFYLKQGTYDSHEAKNYQWFPFSDANWDGYQHFQEPTAEDSGQAWFGDWNQDLAAYKVEDLSTAPATFPNPAEFENDADFNDVVFGSRNGDAASFRRQSWGGSPTRSATSSRQTRRRT